MVTDTAFYRYPHYHLPSDTPEKLDYVRMARVDARPGAVIKELANENRDLSVNRIGYGAMRVIEDPNIWGPPRDKANCASVPGGGLRARSLSKQKPQKKKRPNAKKDKERKNTQ